MGCFTAGGGERRQKGGREGASLDPCGRRVTAKGGAEGYALRAGLGWGWRGGRTSYEWREKNGSNLRLLKEK